jgi:hypothetical protein
MRAPVRPRLHTDAHAHLPPGSLRTGHQPASRHPVIHGVKPAPGRPNRHPPREGAGLRRSDAHRCPPSGASEHRSHGQLITRSLRRV